MFGRGSKKHSQSARQDDNNIFKWWNEGKDLILSNGPVTWKTQSTIAQTTKSVKGISNHLPGKISEDNNLILYISTPTFPDKSGLFMAFYQEQYPGAEDRIRELCLAKAREKYGEILPPKIANRLKKEMDDIDCYGWWSCLYFAYIVADVCRSHGYPCKSNCIKTYLTGYLLGISEINPLTPHYYCPRCKHVEWVDGRKTWSGYDLIPYGSPKEKCAKCGGDLECDGQNIPYSYSPNRKLSGHVSIDIRIPEQAVEAVLTRLDEMVGNKSLKQSGYDNDICVPQNSVAYLDVASSDEMSALCMMGELSGVLPETIRTCDTDILSFMDEKDFKSITELYFNDHSLAGHKKLWDFMKAKKPEKFSDLMRVFRKFERACRVGGEMGELIAREINPEFIAYAMILVKYIWYGRNYPEAFGRALKEYTKKR